MYEQQEGQWRLQFLDQVLFQEATPPLFVPACLGANTAKRPPNHTHGKLAVLTPEGEPAEVACWFLQMEVVEEDDSEVDEDGGRGFERRIEVRTEQRLQALESKVDDLHVALERSESRLAERIEQRLDRLSGAGLTVDAPRSPWGPDGLRA